MIEFYKKSVYNTNYGEGNTMDITDYRILECLKANSRQNSSDIGAMIGLSTSAVIERIKKLEKSGFIKQNTILLNQDLIGRTLTAFINIRLDHPKHNEAFIESVNSSNMISECYYIAGDFDFLLKVMARSTGDLEQVLTFIKSISGVSMTRTSVVLTTNKYDICPLPDREGLTK